MKNLKLFTLQTSLLGLFFAVEIFYTNAIGISVETYQEKMSGALTEVSKQVSSAPKKRIDFALNLFIAHEAWIVGAPQEALIKAVDAFKEAGADRVDINLGLTGWIDQDKAIIAKYDAAVAQIRKHGMKLAINPQYSPIRHKMSSFGDWQKNALKLYAEVAIRYKPDIFVVAHEPSTMSARLKEKISVSKWMDFVRQAAKVVKEQSPKTRIGAGGLASEEDYFEAFAKLPEVEVLTLDIYALRELKTYNQMIKVAKENNKPVYIEETWRSPYFEMKLGITADKASLQNIGNQKFQTLDEQWLRTLTAYAQAQDLEAITPIWMFPLFKYVDGNGHLDDPAYNRAVFEAIMKDERTATFRVLQELIQQNSKP